MIRRWLCQRGWHRVQVTPAPVHYRCGRCGRGLAALSAAEGVNPDDYWYPSD